MYIKSRYVCGFSHGIKGVFYSREFGQLAQRVPVRNGEEIALVGA